MIEANTSARTRDAYRAAHQERSDAIAGFFRRLVGKSSSA